MQTTCPMCAEPIAESAEKCPHCGEALVHEIAPGDQVMPRKDAGGNKVLIAVIVIVCVLLGLPCVIGVIAAISIPNLIGARKAGNEAAAIGALKTINTAQTLFSLGDKDGDGAFDFAESTTELSDNQLIDSILGTGMKQGYVFEVVVDPSAPDERWMAIASPAAPGTTGDRYFYVNQDGAVFESAGPLQLTDDCSIPSGAAPLKKR